MHKTGGRKFFGHLRFGDIVTEEKSGRCYTDTKNIYKEITPMWVILAVLAFVFLHEKVNAKSVLGCVLITAGTLLMVL